MSSSFSRVRVVLGDGSLARYPQGGGLWTIYLQYLLGLKDSGHDILLLELLWRTGSTGSDERGLSQFFQRMKEHGLHDDCAVLLFEKEADPDLTRAAVHGLTMPEIKEWIHGADVFWNSCCGVAQPLLGMFRHPVLLDLDPGHLQVSGPQVEMDLASHKAFLTVGRKLGDADCQVPTLDREWTTFAPFVYLPMWKTRPDPGPEAPFTSVTHWNWEELLWEDRVLSLSKRDAYLRYVDLPRQTRRPFELAATIHPKDKTGDRELLSSHAWRLVDPWTVAGSPAAYQDYIARSRAEISCPKPIFRELNTGWFSDRSACYLASGRPVLAEETGFSESLPTGKGLLRFRDLEEAAAGVEEIDAHYAEHSRAARELAEEHLDSRKCLGAMLEASAPR